MEMFATDLERLAFLLEAEAALAIDSDAVSYTHLTLPTTVVV